MLHYRNVSKVRDSHHKATYQHLSRCFLFLIYHRDGKSLTLKSVLACQCILWRYIKSIVSSDSENRAKSQSLVFTCTTKSLCKSLLDLICSCVAVLLSETPSRFHSKLSRVNHRRVNLDLKTLKHLEVDLAREEFNKLDIGNIISIWKIHFMLELPSKDGEKKCFYVWKAYFCFWYVCFLEGFSKCCCTEMFVSKMMKLPYVCTEITVLLRNLDSAWSFHNRDV